ncbi:MACD1 deacetylase, partial [Polypterus senegalus]|nr:MACD1 deacetylase [Polypterus senegalus]
MKSPVMDRKRHASRAEWSYKNTGCKKRLVVKRFELKGREAGGFMVWTLGHVIHTVGPIVHGQPGEQQKSSLRSCYWTSLDLAARHELKTLLEQHLDNVNHDLRQVSCGGDSSFQMDERMLSSSYQVINERGYPPDEAADIAIRTVKDYLTEYPDKFERVVFCVFLKSDETLYQCKLKQFLTDQPCGLKSSHCATVLASTG